MQIETAAVVCAVRNHGEHGAVVRLLTPDQGLIAAYVRGARGRQMRPILMPGNLVAAQLRWRSESQLPQAMVELARSRASLLGEPLPAAAVEWITTLFAAVLPERQPYPVLFHACSALLDALEAAPSARGWAIGLARVELLILAELGYGRRLEALPASVHQREPAEWAQVMAILATSGRLLEREILAERPRSIVDSRSRLIDRLKRAGGDGLSA